MTAPITLTRESGGRVFSSSSTAGSLVAAVLLMAALFLAHGLQCAAASDHGPVAMNHTLVAPVVAADVGHHGATEQDFELITLVTAVADPNATVGGRDVLGQAVVVCVAVLTAIGLWFRSPRKSTLSGQRALLWPAAGMTLQLRAAARWRPPALDLAVLCVLRT